jgi:hypothetical protein
MKALEQSILYIRRSVERPIARLLIVLLLITSATEPSQACVGAGCVPHALKFLPGQDWAVGSPPEAPFSVAVAIIAAGVKGACRRPSVYHEINDFLGRWENFATAREAGTTEIVVVQEALHKAISSMQERVALAVDVSWTDGTTLDNPKFSSPAACGVTLNYQHGRWFGTIWQGNKSTDLFF